MEYPATKIVHWPSGPVAACDKHANDLVILSSVLGSHVGVEDIAVSAQCSNCMNEAKKTD